MLLAIPSKIGAAQTGEREKQNPGCPLSCLNVVPGTYDLSYTAVPPLSPPNVRNAWLETLSSARFQTYVIAAAGDEEKALLIYRWNSQVSAAWMPDLALVEIGLRNAIHDALSVATGHVDWWHHIALDAKTERNIFDTILRVTRQYGVATPGHVVSDLSLGNWVRLLGTGGRKNGIAIDYFKTLWRPHLSKRFSSATSRQDLYQRCETLRQLRNRIAHHEPLLTTDLAAKHRETVHLMRMVNPILADDLTTNSLVPGLLSRRP